MEPGPHNEHQEQHTRDYFSFFLAVYFFALSVLTPFEVLPRSGKPTAVHLMLSLVFCVLGVVFFLRGQRRVVYVWGQRQP